MNDIIKKIKEWLNISDMGLHVLACFLFAAVLGWGGGVGAGIAAEYKDYAWGGKWDWDDLAADLAGVIIGAVAHFMLFGRI